MTKKVLAIWVVLAGACTSVARAQTPEASSAASATATAADSGEPGAGGAESPPTERDEASTEGVAGADEGESDDGAATPETDTASDVTAEDEGGEASGEEADEGPEMAIALHGTLEAAYGYNFNEPSNGVTAWRWYDTRHNLVGLQAALLSTEWSLGPVSGNLQLQFGALTELFWGSERSLDVDLLWRLVQQATTEWHTPYEPLSLEGGVFTVPFGPEYNNAYLNWNWSTSNLFALMPYQLAGARLNYDFGGGLVARAGVYNGWDRIVTDNNGDKSFLVSLEWDDPSDEQNYFYVNYMVGVERAPDDARGHEARHTLDVYGQWHAAQPLSLRAHVFAGVEPGQPGADGWLGVALFGRVEAHESFSIAARGDVVSTFAGGENLFHADSLALNELPLNTSTLLGSGTLTLDYHPFPFASLRLELRHDRSNFPLFFAGTVPRGPVSAPDPMGDDRPTATDQTTLTAGLTTWF